MKRTLFDKIVLLLYMASVILLILLWWRNNIPPLTFTGYTLSIMGLAMLLRRSGFGRGTWVVIQNASLVLLGAGLILVQSQKMAGVVLSILGSVGWLCSMITGMRVDAVPLFPLDSSLSLAERMKMNAGLSDEPQEQEPCLEVVLQSSGPKPINVMRRLRKLYRPIGLAEVRSMAENTPFVLQTTTSRREADYVAAQLGELGAEVEIREVPGSDIA